MLSDPRGPTPGEVASHQCTGQALSKRAENADDRWAQKAFLMAHMDSKTRRPNIEPLRHSTSGNNPVPRAAANNFSFRNHAARGSVRNGLIAVISRHAAHEPRSMPVA